MATFLSCVFILFFLCFYVVSPIEAQTGGFSVELIHRDSPKSPFYNSSETPYQRLRNALTRSLNRLNHFNQNSSISSSKASQADIIPNNANYLIRISIGTPPTERLAVADTGSDLIWTQCEPCPPSQCYMQDSPLFDPKMSSTYKSLPCSSSQCASLNQKSCSGVNCQYSVSYGDGSFSNGNLATETVTLGSTTGQAVALPGITFGCGTNNGGLFNSKTTGIVGLGGGDISLISQMRTTIAGNQRLEVMSGSTPGGGIVIDSGTTLTLLPQGYNSKLLSVMSSMIEAQPVADPTGSLELCYSFNSLSQVPEVTIHFRGADVKLSRSNFFVKVSEDIVCSVFKGITNSVPIYGNIMQTNFLVGYDIEQQTVSFKPTDCTKQ
ncbi:Aspartic proteinase CDR1 [Citrus sinensis]|uniref:Aspartic proteinase CDR1 n=1 Tax=Citrus sinensis TaxID=2711 RepID=A0ACB8LCN5_CITSI|nr:Aspartic proteinase CDR1 [Citrus sinensis]